MDSDEAIELCGEIIRMIDEDVPEAAFDKAPDFFENVRDKCADIEQTITDTQRVTDGQEQALENMKRGVANWIKD